MRLLLVRHGNTFEDGEKSVWVGSRTDLSLTRKGFSQASAFGTTLKTSRIPIAAIYAGPMLRHRQHAHTIADMVGVDVAEIVVEPRLQELDYGSWEGKTNREIEAQVGHQPVADWNERSLWPHGAGWASDEAATIENVRTFLQDLWNRHAEDATVVAVTSGGVLRYFYKAAARTARGATSNPKVGTGNVGSLVAEPEGWCLTFWNVPPDQVRP